MRITHLSLSGHGAWPDLQIGAVQPQLNVIYGQAHTGKSTAAQLVSHLLYGKASSAWRRQFGQMIPQVEGSLTVDSPSGAYLLRRQYDHSGAGSKTTAGRLTIAAVDGTTVDSQAVRTLLSGLNPRSARELFSVDFSEPPRIEWLLNDPFSKELTDPFSGETARSITGGPTCSNVLSDSGWDERMDRRRVDELIRQRNAMAQELQQQFGVRGKESDLLQRELKDVEAALRNARDQAEQLQARMRGLETELAEAETRLRYFTLDTRAEHMGSGLSRNQYEEQLAKLDTEIAKCQNSLGDFQSCEKAVRTELAQLGADGTADSVSCLADGRATLGVLERLLSDMDAEISQLARAGEPGRGVGHDSHARLLPVSQLMRQQVYTLCGQLTEQQHCERRRQLTAEIRQLQHLQSGLGERLEQLLEQRQSIVRQTQLAGQPVLFVPQPPATDHCRCASHGHFVQQSESMVLGRADSGRNKDEAHHQLGELQRAHGEVGDELAALQLEIDRHNTRWKVLQGERVHLIGSAVIQQKQTELGRLEKKIEQLLQVAETPTALQRPGTWHASDVLAQLSGGDLVQIRLERNNLRATVIDRSGQTLEIDRLTPPQHDQLYLALTLSLVSDYGARGIRLPLVLDEPFLRQDAPHAATMAGVLDEFARAGHQVLIFTEDREARRRFAGLGRCLVDLEELRTRQSPTAWPTVRPATIAAASDTETSEPEDSFRTRVVRETFGADNGPILRLAAVRSDTHSEDVFYLNESSSWDEFPVLGRETAALLGRLGMHSVGDLLAADPMETAARLDRPEIREQTVRLWQIHMRLMCFVPGLSLDDAQLLAAVGINDPDDLIGADLDMLWQSVEEFLATDHGRQFRASQPRCSRSRLGRWGQGARRNRDSWKRSRSRDSDWGRRGKKRPSHRTVPRGAADARSNGQTPRRERSSSASAAHRQAETERRFCLSRASAVEEAPSIGPKTAGRLAKVGIRTVADLLNARPESTAEEIGARHIKSETVEAWQHQARLVCQVPELPGYAAQLLVANGFTNPEQIAATTTDGLVGKILAFCQTKEGQRVMRSRKAPERKKIAAWIECAANQRPLEAA